MLKNCSQYISTYKVIVSIDDFVAALFVPYHIILNVVKNSSIESIVISYMIFLRVYHWHFSKY